MKDAKDNRAYVVSLSRDSIKLYRNYTWVDVVEKDQHFFHPVGEGWPDKPLRYIAFLYDGELQSVHHVESCRVVSDLSAINGNWPKSDTEHVLYKPGSAKKPLKTVKSGRILDKHCWCAIDTLLSGSYKIVMDAAAETKRREEKGVVRIKWGL